jgi:hypothetical protein
VIVGVFVVYIGLIELTRFLPSPASRPDFGPAMRQILIGLMIVLMLRFRPEGIFRERPGLDQVQGLAARLRRLLGARAAASSAGAASAGAASAGAASAGAVPGGVGGAGGAAGAPGGPGPAAAAGASERTGQAAGDGGPG